MQIPILKPLRAAHELQCFVLEMLEPVIYDGLDCPVHIAPSTSTLGRRPVKYTACLRCAMPFATFTILAKLTGFLVINKIDLNETDDLWMVLQDIRSFFSKVPSKTTADNKSE